MYDYETLANNFIETLRAGEEMRAEKEATEALVAAADGDEAVYLNMRNTLGMLIQQKLEAEYSAKQIGSEVTADVPTEVEQAE